MKTNHPNQQTTPVNIKAYKVETWASLTDAQKAHLLLSNNLFEDADIFLQEFKSWEQPEINFNPFKN